MTLASSPHAIGAADSAGSGVSPAHPAR